MRWLDQEGGGEWGEEEGRDRQKGKGKGRGRERGRRQVGVTNNSRKET